MADPKTRKLSVVTVSMLIVVTTFGLANVINNLVELGLALRAASMRAHARNAAEPE
jgi:hypothetical protein